MQDKDGSETFLIREATSNDVQGMLDVFNYYVLNSFAAYLETPVGLEFFQHSQEEQGKKEQFPFYVIEDKGKIIGIGSLKPYFPFPNFLHTGVLSYFILPEYARKGLGTRLLEVLCKIAQEKKMTNLLANVSSKNNASLNFHLKNGFKECGRFEAVGIKFGTYFDIVWLQKFLE